MRIEIPNPIIPVEKPIGKTISSQNQVTGFSDYLMDAINQVDKLQRDSDSSAVALATGEIENLHQVMIDAQKAEIALQFTIQVRNKIIEAYQEIMRMQV